MQTVLFLALTALCTISTTNYNTHSIINNFFYDGVSKNNQLQNSKSQLITVKSEWKDYFTDNPTKKI